MTNAAKVVSLKSVKAATVAPSNEVVTLAPAETLRLAGIVGASAYTKEDSTLNLADSCKRLHKAGVKLGKYKATKTQKACPIIAAYVAGRFPNGKDRKGELVDDAKKTKYASYFKVAVEGGKPYSEGNANKTANGNIMIAFPKAAGSAEAAAKLMAGFNKMKEANTELAKLAGYLIDAIGNAGFDPATAAADAEIDAE
jgi:hypothetical protein